MVFNFIQKDLFYRLVVPRKMKSHQSHKIVAEERIKHFSACPQFSPPVQYPFHIIPKYCTIAIVFLYSSACYGGWLGPANFDECVIESMKGVTSDVAAREIVNACRSKFPETCSKDSEVPNGIYRKLDVQASTGNDFVKGDIYNGNQDWIITKITIKLGAKITMGEGVSLWFANPKFQDFQDLPISKKKEILENYFDQELATKKGYKELTPIDLAKAKTNIIAQTLSDNQNSTDAEEEYSVNVNVPPLTIKKFRVTVSEKGTSEFGWAVTKAYGYRLR